MCASITGNAGGHQCPWPPWLALLPASGGMGMQFVLLSASGSMGMQFGDAVWGSGGAGIRWHRDAICAVASITWHGYAVWGPGGISGAGIRWHEDAICGCKLGVRWHQVAWGCSLGMQVGD
eukprot:959242-Pelagomonas_calceolata.AAC.11